MDQNECWVPTRFNRWTTCTVWITLQIVTATTYWQQDIPCPNCWSKGQGNKLERYVPTWAVQMWSTKTNWQMNRSYSWCCRSTRITLGSQQTQGTSTLLSLVFKSAPFNTIGTISLSTYFSISIHNTPRSVTTNCSDSIYHQEKEKPRILAIQHLRSKTTCTELTWWKENRLWQHGTTPDQHQPKDHSY